MKKIHVTLAFILALCFIFAGCSTDILNETITTSTITTSGIVVSGDLEYYATMSEDTLKEKCKGNYVEVTAAVQNVLYNLGTIYLGDYVSDKIRFSCDFSDSDDLANIQAGDLVTIRGKCSSFLGSTIYLRDCKIEKHINTTDASNPSATKPSTTPPTIPTTRPPHVHSFGSATCTAPKTCFCGATEGKPNGHAWKDATCSEPKTCTVCGTTSGLTVGHNFSDGSCTTCGKADPDQNHETMVWIPTKGGTKYHTHAGCSNMEDPEQVTQSEAESRGFTPCKKCH